MIATERLSKELELINNHGIMATAQLSKMLGVTEMTIRRDMQSLEEQGLIQRVHGGARSLKATHTVSMSQEKNMRERTEHAEEKNAIGKYAAGLIKDGMTIYVDGGTSTAAIIPYMHAEDIRIITNSLLVAEQCHDTDIEVYLLGGRLIQKYSMIAGPLASHDLNQFHFDIAFISCLGIDAEEKLIYTAETDTAEIKKDALRNASQSYLLADASKLHTRSFYHPVSTDMFTNVIMNQPSDYSEDDLPDNFILI